MPPIVLEEIKFIQAKLFLKRCKANKKRIRNNTLLMNYKHETSVVENIPRIK